MTKITYNINDKNINYSQSIATKLNNFFGLIANIIGMKTPKSKTNHKQYLRDANINSLLINSFSETKSVGTQTIPTHILKKI